jgi:PAS domain S-box-containing protein
MSKISRIVLIVDDSPEDRELYRRYLLRDRQYSYTILEATLGEQGLELWQQHQPDAVLLDYRLPDVDGLEFMAQLQPSTQQPCLPVIVVTGQGNEAIAVQAMKAGAQDYIVKGQITPERLQIAVNGAIETVQLRTQLQQRIERERVVAHITQQIHQSLNLEEILQRTVTEVRQFLHTDRVLVFQLKPDGNGTVVAESVGAEWRSLLFSKIYEPCLAENYLRFSQPEFVTHDPAFVEDYVKRYRQGQVTAIPDIHDSHIDPCHVELLAQFQVKANLVVPIQHENQFWGLLIAHHCAKARFWQPLEIELLKELAIQMSIALRQAKLYQQAHDELVERRQVEAELRQSEERLRLALAASRMGTWNWNIQTGKISWSDNLEALFGLKTGEFDGSFEMFVARLHPDDRDRVLAAIDHAVTTGENYDIEFRVVYPNGTIRWALSQGKVFYDQHGQPMQMAGVDLDITDRKLSAKALRDSEERFRQLAENIDAVFWMKEVSENRVSYVSPAYERLWGLNPEELYQGQQSWVDRIHPEDRESTDRAFHEKAAAGKFDEEYRIILPDGSIRWVHDRCFPLQDETGEIYRFAGIAEDISDRKQNQQNLYESEERLQLGMQIAGFALAKFDYASNTVELSPETAALYGLPVHELVVSRERIHATFHPEEQSELAQLIEQVLDPAGSGWFAHDHRVVWSDGNVRWLSVCKQVFFDGSRTPETPIYAILAAIDITDRKKTEIELQENRAKLQQQLAEIEAIYETAPIGLNVLDSDLRFVRVNQRLAEINGFPIEAHIGRTLRELLPALADDAEAILRPILETGQPRLNIEIQGETPAQPGVPRIWLEHFLPLKDGDRVIGISTVCEEITDRKRAELALQERERQFTTLAEASPTAIFRFDTLNNCVYVNRRWCEITGQPPEAAFGMGWVQMVHPDDRVRIAKAWLEWCANAEKQGVFQIEGRCIRPDGCVIYYMCQALPEMKPDNTVVAYIGTLIDVSDRKQAELALGESEERLQMALEGSGCGLWDWNIVTDEDYLSLRWLEMLGYEEGELPGNFSTWEKLIHPDDKVWVMERLNAHLQDDSVPYKFEYRMLTKSGQWKWIANYGKVVLRDQQGNPLRMAGIHDDVTDRKLVEEERDRLLKLEQAARAEAERANRIKDEFLAVLSHELRSPLNPILGWTKLLQTRKFDETKTAEALATIERNVKLQTQLIDDLLDVAKILRGKLSIDAAPVNLAFVIESAIDTVSTAAFAKSIMLHPVLPNIGQVCGDSNRLQQIVWNLLSNAIKFTPKGGRVEIRLQQVDDQAHIIVSDTGIGINPDFLPHIFESFRQEDVSITRKYGGLGLGLAIVRQLVEAHGGTITADSPGEGLGATFTVWLPLLNVEPEIKQIDDLPQEGLDLTGIRVLTVDDDPDARELLTILLAQYGAEVLTVASAAEVLANLESFQPDVLVSDIGMPEVDGYSLIQQIRTLTPEKGGQIPAIALTAYAREDDHQRAIRSGYQRHVTKPLDPEELVQVVVALANRKLLTM